jgi:GDP-L-fucose synthase
MNLSETQFESLISVSETPPLINVGSGRDLTIRELASTVCAVLGYDGNLIFDSSKPDGTPRKLLDSSKLFSLGWKPSIPLPQGIRLAWDDYRVRLQQSQQLQERK